MILVDSSAWISYFGGLSTAAASRLDQAIEADESVALVDLVVTEVLQGFRIDRDFELARRTLAGVHRLPMPAVTYVNAARLHRRLRGHGVTAHTIDCLIAQVCLDAGASLLTDDKDFRAIARHSRLRLLAA